MDALADNWKVHLAALLVTGAGLGVAAYAGYATGKTNVRSEQLARKKIEREYMLQVNDVDPVLKELRAFSRKHNLGKMTTNVQSGQMLTFMCRNIQAKKVLDIGVFTGCSAFALALGLPDDGKVIACDISQEYADLGKPYWDRGGVSKKIDLCIAPALKTLNELINTKESESFDVAFIDADKENYPKYYELAYLLVRQGGLIIVDNTLWSGYVYDESVQDEETVAIRELNRRMRGDSRVDYMMLNFADGTGIAQKL